MNNTKKLTNDDVDNRLLTRNIKRLDNYINNNTKINFQCLITECNYIWPTKPSHIFDGHGCPMCVGNARLNNAIIDKRLINKNIKRLSNYVNSGSSLDFQCLITECGYIWSTSSDSISSGTGCPKCANVLKLTNVDVDKRIFNKNIKRIGNYENNYTAIEFQCLNDCCNYIWLTAPASIFTGSGCPKCAGNFKLTNEYIDNKLIFRNIKRIDDYINCNTIIRFQCLVNDCNNIWTAMPNNILNANHGCPKCSAISSCKKRTKTNEDVDIILFSKNIKRLGNYINSATHILMQCLDKNCEHKWNVIPRNVINNDRGCPKCNLSGKYEKLIFNLLKQSHIEFINNYNIKNISILENKKYRVDFYFPQSNIIIEYNGSQHYRTEQFGGISKDRAEQNFIKQQARDLYVQSFCDQNNIKLIWIDGRKYKGKKLEKYILEELLPILAKDKNNMLNTNKVAITNE